VDRLPGVGASTVPLLSFTPYVAATAPIPLLCAAALGRWRAAAVAGVVTAGLLAAVAPRALGSGQPPAAGPELRVLSANLEFGGADPDALVDLVRRTGTEVLSTQELTPAAVTALERAGLTRLLPYKVLEARPGPSGIGIYSRHPLRALSPVAGTTTPMPRAELSLPGDVQVEVVAVHPLPPLSATASENWRRDIAAIPGTSGNGPTRIVAGDFNATMDHARFRATIARGYADVADRAGKGLTPTWGVQTGGPFLVIDHILVSRRVAVRRVEAHALPGSDHRALSALLRLPTA
jgi:endonuclease/exonuclease/phosphatase (EEP) superfamily protein YafD